MVFMLSYGSFDLGRAPCSARTGQPVHFHRTAHSPPPLPWPESGRGGYPARMQLVTRLVLILAILASPAIAAEHLVGRARVIDGDTIVVGGVHVRLQGVAAPEVAHPGQPQDEPGGPEAWAFMQ